jgi:hypothetical protein
MMDSAGVAWARKPPKKQKTTGRCFDVVKRLSTRTLDDDVRRVPEWKEAVRQNRRATTLYVHGKTNAAELEEMWTDAIRALHVDECEPRAFATVWNAHAANMRCLHWYNRKEALDLSRMDLSSVTELHLLVGHLVDDADAWTSFCTWMATSRSLVDLRLDFAYHNVTSNRWSQFQKAMEQQPRLLSLELVGIFELDWDIYAWVDARKWIHFGLQGVLSQHSHPCHWPPSIMLEVHHTPKNLLTSTRARVRLDDSPWHPLPTKLAVLHLQLSGRIMEHRIDAALLWIGRVCSSLQEVHVESPVASHVGFAVSVGNMGPQVVTFTHEGVRRVVRPWLQLPHWPPDSLLHNWLTSRRHAVQTVSALRMYCMRSFGKGTIVKAATGLRRLAWANSLFVCLIDFLML